ncbi:hypothetical protein GCM10022239_22810 [Leifsonia bigeumensis]|uniref:DUF2510 domain-containing protein n=1 Tax=Leifsonella bigeumensis TaxID=433643 RepID=A0ABP7FSL4_9MICO
MDDNSFYGAPAGWYPDPLGLPQLRWWDSTAWTHQTAEARAPMVMQETTYAWPEDELDREEQEQQDLLTRRERRERERRDGNDIVAPTALTLLQLEPPSRADVQVDVPEPSPFNPFAGAEDVGGTAGTVPDPMAATRSAALQDPQGEALPSSPFDEPYQTTSYSQPVNPGAQPHPGTHQTGAPQTAVPQQEESFFSGFATQVPHQAPPTQQTFDWAPRLDPLNDPQYQAYLKAQTAPHAKATHNGPVWVIALIPLIQLVLSLLVLTAFGTAEASGAMAAIWLAPYPIVVGLAALDRRNLRKTGHEVTAHWLWALLTAPVYLIVRAVAAIRESGGGFGPVLVWFALGLLQIGAIVAVPGLLISTVPAVFADQAEQSVISDAAVIGANIEVSCPDLPPVLIGQQFECAGVRGNDQPDLDIVVSLQRVNGWIDWQVEDWGIYTIG